MSAMQSQRDRAKEIISNIEAETGSDIKWLNGKMGGNHKARIKYLESLYKAALINPEGFSQLLEDARKIFAIKALVKSESEKEAKIKALDDKKVEDLIQKGDSRTWSEFFEMASLQAKSLLSSINLPELPKLLQPRISDAEKLLANFDKINKGQDVSGGRQADVIAGLDLLEIEKVGQMVGGDLSIDEFTTTRNIAADYDWMFSGNLDQLSGFDTEGQEVSANDIAKYVEKNYILKDQCAKLDEKLGLKGSENSIYQHIQKSAGNSNIKNIDDISHFINSILHSVELGEESKEGNKSDLKHESSESVGKLKSEIENLKKGNKLEAGGQAEKLYDNLKAMAQGAKKLNDVENLDIEKVTDGRVHRRDGPMAGKDTTTATSSEALTTRVVTTTRAATEASTKSATGVATTTRPLTEAVTTGSLSQSSLTTTSAISSTSAIIRESQSGGDGRAAAASAAAGGAILLAAIVAGYIAFRKRTVAVGIAAQEDTEMQPVGNERGGEGAAGVGNFFGFGGGLDAPSSSVQNPEGNDIGVGRGNGGNGR